MGKPEYREIDRMGNSRSPRRGARITNFLLHTQEGNGTAESLAGYLNNPANQVSYHYTLRDAILCDVVDTDYASWSVLDANASTINLCFAGSRASWSREQWLAIKDDIRIAAWIAVQDAKKYGYPADVIAPPYRRAAGISDHRYVTDVLGYGTHTDVGPGFPWDVFSAAVREFASGTLTSEGDDDVSWLTQTLRNFKGTALSYKDLFWWMDKNTAESLEQFMGPEKDGKRQGWKILGRSKVADRDNTVVEALAEIRDDVAEIKALLQERKA